jgi:hypothetical protein
MKETKELTLEDLVGVIATALVGEILKENGIDGKGTLSYGEKEETKEAVEKTESTTIWYLVLDEDGEFDGVVHKTSKPLDIREFIGRSLEVFDNYKEANEKRKELNEITNW